MISEQRIKELEDLRVKAIEDDLHNRRLRILLISERDLMNLFDINRTSEMLTLGFFPTLPKDYKIRSVLFDYRRQSFGLMIWSMEFTSIEPGMEIPWLINPIVTMQVDYRKVVVNETISNNHANSVGLTNPSSKFRLHDPTYG